MKIALEEAYKAYLKGEVPVGAVIVKDGKIIAKAHNKREELQSSLAHAEILAIKEASKHLKNWRLNNCEMYITLEPCPMCAGAIIQSRISKVHIGTFDPLTGACGSVINLLQNENIHRIVNIEWEYNEECSKILTDFFKNKR